jgi:hypothetical protein
VLPHEDDTEKPMNLLTILYEENLYFCSGPFHTEIANTAVRKTL